MTYGQVGLCLVGAFAPKLGSVGLKASWMGLRTSCTQNLANAKVLPCPQMVFMMFSA